VHRASRKHKLQRAHSACIAVISFGSEPDSQRGKRTRDLTRGLILRHRAKIKAAPKIREPLRYCRCELFYWVGSSSCENPIVLIERNDGVLGGKNCGPSVKF
jgi:hypothetical protein